MPYIGNQPYQGVIDSGNILNGSIDTVDLKDGSVTSAKLETIGGLTAGNYTTANITVDSKGRVTLASNGSGGVSSITGTADQIAASTSTGAITLSLPQSINTTSSPSFANVTLTGELRGPSTLIIDPAAVGDDTGTVRVRGNLQVDGTTTTVNSTTLEIADLNIILAKNAANAAAADGAGITVAGASATLTYAASTDTWNVNKNLLITPGTANGVLYLNTSKVATTGSTLTYNGTTLTAVNNASANYITLSRTSATARDWALGIDGDGGFRLTDSTGSAVILSALPSGVTFLASESDLVFKYNTSNEGMRLTSTGLGIGLGGGSPTAKLHVTGTSGGGYQTSNKIILQRTDATLPTGSIEFQGSGGHTSPYWNILTDADVGNDFGVSYNGSKFLQILSSGNVGIGAPSPSAKLNIVTNSATQALKITSSNDWGNINSPFVDIDGNANGGGDGNILRVKTGAARADVEILEVVNGNGTQFLVRGNGDVGIGTTSLSHKLHVYGVNPGLRVEGDGGSYYPEIRLDGANGSMFLTTYFGATITATNATGNNTIRFRSGGTTSAGAYGGSDRMIIDSNGAVCIGTSSASGSRLSTYSTANDTNVYFERNTGATAPTTWPVIIRGQSGGSNSASYAGLRIDGYNGLGNSSTLILGQGLPATYGYHDVGFLQLYGGGLWQAQEYHWSTNGTTTYRGTNYQGCEFYNHRSDSQVAFTFYAASTGMNASVVCSIGARTTTNSTYNLFFGSNGNGTGQFAVRDSGNCVNTNNSYGSISDVKLKQDIVDASNQWDDIKNLRIRKFRWKSEVAENPSAKPYLGLIAQEAELVSPGLIEETADYEEFEEDSLDENGNVLLKEDGTPHKVRNRRALGTTTKSIKYSILYMKAIKALQEAMERIESLEAKVAALEGTQP